MPLKLRPKGSDDPFYNPQRDLAKCYPQMIEQVVERFNGERWPELAKLTADQGVTQDQLCDAMDAYIAFLNETHKNPEESMADIMRRSGWFAQPKIAQIAIMAMLGTVCTGQLFHAIREDSTPEAQMPGLGTLADSMAEARKLTYTRPWMVRVKMFFWGLLGRLRR